jgi:exoribonuclease-2
MESVTDLLELAKRLMVERGLEPEFTKEEMHQLAQIHAPAELPAEDLRSLLWCSIDNDDSLDLDQLTYAAKNGSGITIWIAVADVASLVKKGTPIDDHARHNTTSVYTTAKIFPMLPEKLSTDLTSLNEHEERSAMVVRIELDAHGEVQTSDIFEAVVYNHCKLAYNSVGPWLEGHANPPEKVMQVEGLEQTLLVQSEAAQILRRRRYRMGSLTLESSKAEARVNQEGHIVLGLSPHNFAHQLVEEFMVAANGVMAEHFTLAKIVSLRRVVKTPKNWFRIVQVAREYGDTLPERPDSKALDAFLVKRKEEDPDSFPDLSLTIIKLLGRGEYVVEHADGVPVGHFALALTSYTHSTAPNRRYPDLISQRQYKALLRKEKNPYTLSELTHLAEHCTMQEDAANKVERQVTKSAAAMLLAPHIGVTFRGIITGAGEKGTWVRIFDPPVEGKIVIGYKGLEVGDKVKVKLRSVDVQKGFIDFAAL